MPHIFENEKGALFMPAYAWGKGGNHSLLLTSTDRGRRWTVLSSIASTTAIVKAGVPVTTPWLETTVSPTKGGDWLAIVRTGSNAKASLVSVRSVDRGLTWSLPEKLPIAGKLPTLQLLQNGMLALLTAHSKNHCRLYLSTDGKGRAWGPAHALTSQSGGNAGTAITGVDSLVVFSPANRRIDAWRVSLPLQPRVADDLAAPTAITLAKGVLSWTCDAASYHVRPVLQKTAAGYEETELFTHATIATRERRLDLGRQLLIGGTYHFEISAVNHEGQISHPSRSAEFVNR